MRPSHETASSNSDGARHHALRVRHGLCAESTVLYFFDDGDLSHYKGAATEIEYPDVNTVVLDDVTQASPPLTVANNEPREFWDLTLEEAMQNALDNSKVMRSLGGTPVTSSNLLVSSINNARVLQAPETYTTVYTPALRDSDPRFGTEAALSAFDAQLTSSLFWNQNDRPINLRPDLQIFARNVFRQDTTAFTSQIAKTSAAGTQFFARQSTNYEWNNNPSNEYPSIWQAAVEVEFTHPLLQGSGVDFNRIAGPNAVSGVYNGVTIARINTDIALTDFEIGVRNLVNDVENAYWNLYFAYRRLDANVVGRDSSLVTWRKVHAMAAAGAADAAQEAQAREQYFLFRGNVETALSDMYSAESALRYMMGLAATDGRLVRPADEPTTAKIVFDWTEANQESLSRSIELRRQRWMIKRRELELAASKNFLFRVWMPTQSTAGEAWATTSSRQTAAVNGRAPTPGTASLAATIRNGRWASTSHAARLPPSLGRCAKCPTAIGPRPRDLARARTRTNRTS